MNARGATSRHYANLLASLCLLVAFGGLAATPLAALLTAKEECKCCAKHDGTHPCCCRRAARTAGASIESAWCCAGQCRLGTPVPLRLGLFVPLEPSSGVSRPATGALAICLPSHSVRSSWFGCALHERSPPPAHLDIL